MQLQERKELMVRLGEYMKGSAEDWQVAKRKAHAENNWFIAEFVDRAAQTVADNYLTAAALDQLISNYQLVNVQTQPKKVGIVMAGNIPLVGFHDLLCTFLVGHIAVVKPSSKDTSLMKQLLTTLVSWNAGVGNFIILQDLLKGCDAYIATGSNNTGRYFEYYFGKYPHIIRKNRTSVAILSGTETPQALEKLADDVHLYFGLGCRNVTQLYVPHNYDFVPLLNAFRKYDYLINHNKYKNNYDHNLAMHILNNKRYMTNGSILLIEDPSPFSPIAQVHFSYYDDKEEIRKNLHDNQAIQCIVDDETAAFGSAQQPQLCEFADGVDTINFLQTL